MNRMILVADGMKMLDYRWVCLNIYLGPRKVSFSSLEGQVNNYLVKQSHNRPERVTWNKQYYIHAMLPEVGIYTFVYNAQQTLTAI